MNVIVEMPADISVKQFPQSLYEIDGLSRRQIEEHFSLYENYVKKTNEIRNMLRNVDRDNVNAIYSELRELKVELSYTLNAVKLHEAYFGNIGGTNTRPSDRLMDLINRSFGSFEAWKKDLKATGMAARGWAITACDFDDNRLHNYIADDHNTYGIWNALPIIVLDTYEHAYVIDYGVKRAPYIDTFLKVINWDEVNRRVDGIVMGMEPKQSM